MFPKDTLAVWKNHRQINARDHEKFGVIIGSCSEPKMSTGSIYNHIHFPTTKAQYIVSCCETESSKKLFDLAFAESGGTSIYWVLAHTSRTDTYAFTNRQDGLVALY